MGKKHGGSGEWWGFGGESERGRERGKGRDMWAELIKHTNSVSILKHSCIVGHIFS